MTVLAIDDDFTQLEKLKAICESLEYPGVRLLAAESMREALAVLSKEVVDLVLSDYRLPDGNGLAVLDAVKKVNPSISVAIMTAFENAREAVEVLKQGADDYLIKPTTTEDIRHVLIRINEQMTLRGEEKMIHAAIDATFSDDAIAFKSRRMADVLQTAVRAAGTDVTMLVTGESGTGKELLARLIHNASPRRAKAFVTVNIAALPESLIESELFGHRKGSFTGALESRVGRFEEADGGTIFIDEIGDVTPPLQVKLLRVLQFGEIERIGENATKRLDVRIIAATNRDLPEMVKANRFRSDLFYRLNVVNIALPPLRRRREDIPALVERFMERSNAKNGRAVKGISREAMEKLMRHSFPGNVRELENIIERGVVLCRGELLSTRDLPELADEDPESDGCRDAYQRLPYEEAMARFERELLASALALAEGNQSRAARSLEITERHLRSRMEKLDMPRQRSG